MESNEFNFKGTVLNGFLMLFVALVLPFLAVWCVYKSILLFDLPDHGWLAGSVMALGVIVAICEILILCGFIMLEPNTADVTTWFGKYSGTFNRTGF